MRTCAHLGRHEMRTSECPTSFVVCFYESLQSFLNRIPILRKYNKAGRAVTGSSTRCRARFRARGACPERAAPRAKGPMAARGTLRSPNGCCLGDLRLAALAGGSLRMTRKRKGKRVTKKRARGPPEKSDLRRRLGHLEAPHRAVADSKPSTNGIPEHSEIVSAECRPPPAEDELMLSHPNRSGTIARFRPAPTGPRPCARNRRTNHSMPPVLEWVGIPIPGCVYLLCERPTAVTSCHVVPFVDTSSTPPSIRSRCCTHARSSGRRAPPSVMGPPQTIVLDRAVIRGEHA